MHWTARRTVATRSLCSENYLILGKDANRLIEIVAMKTEKKLAEVKRDRWHELLKLVFQTEQRFMISKFN